MLLSASLGCHRHAAQKEEVNRPPVDNTTRVDRPPVRDTTRVVRDVVDPAIAALFKDTAPSNAFATEGRTYNVQKTADQQALQTALKRQRALWQAAKPTSYRFLLRADCFCPGPHGWLLLEVRSGQPLKAWDRTGKRVSPTDWAAFTIDQLYDGLGQTNNQMSQVQIAFDESWHYPRYLRTSMIYPDGWSITQIRALRPL
jgi:hypothetical protein